MREIAVSGLKNLAAFFPEISCKRMTVTLDLPPGVEQAILAEAEAKGITIDQWVSEVLTIKELIAEGRE